MLRRRPLPALLTVYDSTLFSATRASSDGSVCDLTLSEEEVALGNLLGMQRQRTLFSKFHPPAFTSAWRYWFSSSESSAFQSYTLKSQTQGDSHLSECGCLGT